jgi:hypothetical protein
MRLPAGYLAGAAADPDRAPSQSEGSLRERAWCGVPNIWHGAVVLLAGTAQLLDRQGRVHARVSVDFPKEFGWCFAIPLRRP